MCCGCMFCICRSVWFDVVVSLCCRLRYTNGRNGVVTHNLLSLFFSSFASLVGPFEMGYGCFVISTERQIQLSHAISGHRGVFA